MWFCFMADSKWKGSTLKGLNNNLGLSMPKRKLCELYLEETKQARKRNISEIQPVINSVIKKMRKYTHFETLAAHYKGYLIRNEMAKKVYHFYWI